MRKKQFAPLASAAFHRDFPKQDSEIIGHESPCTVWLLDQRGIHEYKRTDTSQNNMAVKEMCIQNRIVKEQYQTADNPIFEVFYLEGAHAVIADFSGNPPKEYTL